MNKKLNKKGFTLMEMLIVVGIIAVLIAIAIPTFNNALEKAKEAADMANIRAAYAEASVKSLSSDDSTGEATSQAMTQAKKGWDNGVTWPDYLGAKIEPVKGNTVKVSITEDGKVSCTIGTPATGD